MYESPLIEQGSVILGGTQQEFGFALRQQYFHKSVMLLLQHDDGFTKGIILNRPSAYELDGWRVWFGGDVAEGELATCDCCCAARAPTADARALAYAGAMFRGASEAKGEREIICLHALTSESAARLSMPIIKGVACTSSQVQMPQLAHPRPSTLADGWSTRALVRQACCISGTVLGI